MAAVDVSGDQENLPDPIANRRAPAVHRRPTALVPFLAPRQGNAFRLKYKYPCHLLGHWENFDEE
jgi:hypothetical protein